MRRPKCKTYIAKAINASNHDMDDPKSMVTRAAYNNLKARLPKAEDAIWMERRRACQLENALTQAHSLNQVLIDRLGRFWAPQRLPEHVNGSDA